MSTESPRAQVAAALRRERRRAGLSLSEAARQAGIGKSTLSQLESGDGNPSLETMWALATAYGVQLARLLDPPAAQVSVIRADEAPILASSDADYRSSLLSASPPNARRDLYIITVQPGSARESQPHPAGTVEHLVVGSGAARVEVDGQVHELGPGDYMVYPGDEPHRLTALEPGTRLVFVVEST